MSLLALTFSLACLCLNRNQLTQLHIKHIRLTGQSFCCCCHPFYITAMICAPYINKGHLSVATYPNGKQHRKQNRSSPSDFKRAINIISKCAGLNNNCSRSSQSSGSYLLEAPKLRGKQIPFLSEFTASSTRPFSISRRSDENVSILTPRSIKSALMPSIITSIAKPRTIGRLWPPAGPLSYLDILF